MAKKAAVQQLQADLQTDEDLNKFLERPGLLLLDVYSQWCGPCLGMVGVLRKIKLEIGGDNLQLAICKSDTIKALSRFIRKSEPTWLFVTGGKAVNLMYGTDVPKLVAVMVEELEKTIHKVPRSNVYEISELQPIEIEKLRVKTAALEKLQQEERDELQKKRTEYLNRVTDTIMENLPDIGVTVFGPQVNRDMFKKLVEPADALKMQCKDRKVLPVALQDFETVNYACANPLSFDVLEQLDGKELLMCYWKVDETQATMPEILGFYANELMKERVDSADEMLQAEHAIAPLVTTLDIKVNVEVKEDPMGVKQVSTDELDVEDDADDEDEADISEEETLQQQDTLSFPAFPFDMDIEESTDLKAAQLDEQQVVKTEEEEEEEPAKISTCIKTVRIPPIWVPNNRRTHAALIYMFFRGQTADFLPAEPKAEPPHLVMAFEATKRHEIIDVMQNHTDDVPLYGYFNCDIPNEAVLLANTHGKYEKRAENSNDKLVLKVNKIHSNMMLLLVGFSPTYVSPNVIVGRNEALQFFPAHYKVEEDEIVLVVEKKPKKQKKHKKGDEVGRAHEESVLPALAELQSIELLVGEEHSGKVAEELQDEDKHLADQFASGRESIIVQSIQDVAIKEPKTCTEATEGILESRMTSVSTNGPTEVAPEQLK